MGKKKNEGKHLAQTTREQEEIQQLNQELEAKKFETKQNYDLYLRQAAELDNFKKSTYVTFPIPFLWGKGPDF